MKVRPVEAELFHVDAQIADEQTYRHDEANSRFL